MKKEVFLLMIYVEKILYKKIVDEEYLLFFRWFIVVS